MRAEVKDKETRTTCHSGAQPKAANPESTTQRVRCEMMDSGFSLREPRNDSEDRTV
jgi:hypothetical protein